MTYNRTSYAPKMLMTVYFSGTHSSIIFVPTTVTITCPNSPPAITTLRMGFEPTLTARRVGSFALTVVARDGGNRTSTAAVFVDVTDVNDNRPQFAEREYRRTLEDGSDAFFPDFFVKVGWFINVLTAALKPKSKL